ncbi:helix-turn-helix transcriptional regulator [Paenibacillus piri]|nr:helix-turn-helix domain-containing protein [Paenibacillus piri]
MVGHNLIASLDTYVQTVDQLMIKEMFVGDWMDLFYRPVQGRNAYMDEYQVSKALRVLRNTIPELESVYLFRLSDGLVMTSSERTTLAQFHDHRFLESIVDEPALSYWLQRRTIAASSEKPEEVISLIKEYPANSGELGYVVVNISINAIPRIVGASAGSSPQYIRLTDRSGAELFNNGGPTVDDQSNDGLLFRLKSDYTGWTITSGIKPDILRIAKTLSYVWSGAALTALLLGCSWMLFVTRKHYRPIATIMNKIGVVNPTTAESGASGKVDELSVIEATLVGLIHDIHEQREKENKHLATHKRNVFYELVLGHRLWTEQLTDELNDAGVFARMERGVIASIEIDQYRGFQEKYSPRDQELFKYMVQKVMQELSIDVGVIIWSEWIKPNQLTAVVSTVPGEEAADVLESSLVIGDRLRGWLGQHVPFTVTLGISDPMESGHDLSFAYAQSAKALKYKPTFGGNRSILIRDIDFSEREDIIHQLEAVRQVALVYRLGDDMWKEKLNALFDVLESNAQDRDELVNLLHYFLYCLNKEMAALAPDIRVHWHLKADQLMEKITNFELLDEIRLHYTTILQEASDVLAELRQRHPGQDAVRLIKEWVTQQYADSDLSLNLVSDKLGLYPSYVSRIFREETGENFLDYVTRIRMEEAKRLLLETKEPVQSVAAMVGYLHAASFIRVFKRATNLTPGDYRKLNGRQI